MNANRRVTILSMLVFTCLVTTSYHGNSSEGTDSTGAKTEAKLAGACK